MSVDIKIPKKLIEVALPLDAINSSAAEDKGNPFLKGHPRSLHQYWARRPLLAARAIIFAQMVNDPGYERNLGRGVNKEQADKERKRLFKIIEELIKWENLNNEKLLQEARSEIEKSWQETCSLNKGNSQLKTLFHKDKLPKFNDPFSGGGSIPVEALRLGLETIASDLNPVAVTINKAMIEILPRFSNMPSVNQRKDKLQLKLESNWIGNQGFAEDVRKYGAWIREELDARLANICPPISITEKHADERPDLKNLIGESLNIITWIWTKTVKSPNPKYSHVDVPLVSSFVLQSKGDKHFFIEPRIEKNNYSFHVKTGAESDIKKAAKGTKVSRGSFACLMSGTPISSDHIRSEAMAGRLGVKLMAIVAERNTGAGRVYLSPTSKQEEIAKDVNPRWRPEIEFFKEALGFRVGNYGMSKWSDLYTNRQLEVLYTLTELVKEVKSIIKVDAESAGFVNDNIPLNKDGKGSLAYAEAISVFLAFAVDKFADYNNKLCTWNPTNQNIGHLFTKQTIPMAWDFPEASPVYGGLSFDSICIGISKSIELLPTSGLGIAVQKDAAESSVLTENAVISTDPPYYDNIGYADLSDFFYVWLRLCLKDVYPEVFTGIETPKISELVATPARHGGSGNAESFFLNGMSSVMKRLSKEAHPTFPITIYYAFKQQETSNQETSSTGWVTFLEAVIKSGFRITGTWPLRTEREARSRGQNSNALASSILLVCRKREAETVVISRRNFIRELNETLPNSLADMIESNEQSPVAPVDLSQAIIGPGMALFSKYTSVIEADGNPMSVKTALQLINRFLAEDDFDHDTQFCMNWFEVNGWVEGRFGEADVLARAKGTSVEGLRDGGVAKSYAGKFSLLKWQDLDENWNPETDNRTSHWEMLHHLIRAYNKNGESSAGEILSRIHSKSETIRALAYRLYTVCERKKYADDAANYNNLILAWEAIEMTAQSVGVKDTQISLFDNESEIKETTKKTKRKK